MYRTVIFYRTSSNKCPIEDFFEMLSDKSSQKVAWVLRLIEQLEKVPSQYFCKMEGTEHIWECRIKLGSDIYRIFSFWDGHYIVLTHGFIKKSQKSPLKEIQKAQEYRRDYWLRKQIDNK